MHRRKEKLELVIESKARHFFTNSVLYFTYLQISSKLWLDVLKRQNLYGTLCYEYPNDCCTQLLGWTETLDYHIDASKSLNQGGKQEHSRKSCYFKISLTVRAFSHLLKAGFLFAALQCSRLLLI